MRIGIGRVLGALFGAALLVAPGVPVRAVDGVIEINHAAALAGGVSPGDSAGYPVTLSASGSYRLTGNLTPPDQNTDVIELGSTGNVAIDLNGFSILGTAVCTIGPGGHVSSCSNTGSGNGIVGSGFTVAIEHGVIQGMGNLAVSMGGATGVSLRDVGISHNGGGGVDVGTYGFLRDALVGLNGGTGIKTGFASRLIDSGGSANSGNGLEALDALRVRGGQFADNGLMGIVAGSTATIRGARVVSNAGNGITVGAGSLLIGNMVSFNGGFGIDFGGAVAGMTTGYADNAISGNTGGERNGAGGTQLESNICGSTLCP